MFARLQTHTYNWSHLEAAVWNQLALLQWKTKLDLQMRQNENEEKHHKVAIHRSYGTVLIYEVVGTLSRIKNIGKNKNR
jgi:hypothetical protein